jgi:hypothetical protein
MRQSRYIRGRRASLERVRDAEILEELIVEGRGVASLAGLERMTNLDALALERLHEPDLTPLAQLPRLERLLIEELAGDIDFAPLAGGSTSARSSSPTRTRNGSALSPTASSSSTSRP